MNMSCLRVEDVVLRFGRQAALDHVSLTVGAGEIVGLIGPNGSGKTCLLNVVTGVYRPQAGRVFLDDVELTGRKSYAIARQGVARTFQAGELVPGLTVLENVMLGCERIWRSQVIRVVLRTPLARREEKEFREAAMAALEQVEMAGYAGSLAETLPWAQRKLVGIAGCLVANPRVLLLDEPMSGMNNTEKEGLMDVIQLVRKERRLAVLLVEHDVPVVRSIADRLLVLSFGKKLAEGIPDRVLNLDEVKLAYLGQSSVAEAPVEGSSPESVTSVSRESDGSIGDRMPDVTP